MPMIAMTTRSSTSVKPGKLEAGSGERGVRAPRSMLDAPCLPEEAVAIDKIGKRRTGIKPQAPENESRRAGTARLKCA